MNLLEIRTAIIDDTANRQFKTKGWLPVYTAHPSAKILVIGQAPGRLAQESGVPWDDQSGDNLRTWLGVDKAVFYDKTKIALVPMDFFFPGSKDRGDAPPRKEFAPKWHPHILKNLRKVQLTVLIGQYAHEHYLGARQENSLTANVREFKQYLPEVIPLVHPSPRNNIWQKKNPWFQKQVIPQLQKRVAEILK